jgi:hypothetical protein
MSVSEARVAANRRNALRSTGPKTEEGKQKSRANALKHGLCASVVVAEDAKLVQQRASDWFDALKPRNEFQSWLVDEISVISLRIDRCERMERRARDVKAMKAELCWEDDRRLDAVRLGGLLARRPDEVIEELRRTPQGCEWLMTRWAMLAHTADVKGSWTTEQSRMAFDLLGTPIEFREAIKPGASLDLDGRLVEPADDPAAVARREIDALKQRREIVEGLDEVNQALAVADLNDEDDPELRRLRRYESALHRRLRWCLAQFRYESPHRGAHPSLERPRWDARPEAAIEPAPVPEPEKPKEFWQVQPPNPPFDLEADEVPAPGEILDLPAILASRREKKLQKAEARRESRRRKLERLRA